MQKAKLGMVRELWGVPAQVGMSMAVTGTRAGDITEVLIVMLWTLAPAVTDLRYVQTDSGTTTAVETRAGGRITLLLVLVLWAVIDSVTAYIQREAVARTWQWNMLQQTYRD